MARPRVEPETIREAITLLEAEGKPVSVTAIRQRLGSGSDSTVGAVLNTWRREQAAAVLPAVAAIPERVTHLVQNLWAEACQAAPTVHEPEREKFQRERPEQERLKAEMNQEIARLEAELSRVEAERESAKVDLATAKEELAQDRLKRARAEATIGTLQAELTELRDESRKAHANRQRIVEPGGSRRPSTDRGDLTQNSPTVSVAIGTPSPLRPGGHVWSRGA